MTTTPDTLTQWLAAEQAVRDAMATGPGAGAGVARPEQLAGKSGLEVMQALLRGEIPQATISATLDFLLLEVERGRALFQGRPGPQHLNPMGSVHGGWFATLLDSALGCAVHTMLPAGSGYTTAELGVNLVKALTPKVADPAVIYDMGGKFDKSFNEAAYNGAERWKKETGKPYLEFEISNEASASRPCAAWPSAAPTRSSASASARAAPSRRWPRTSRSCSSPSSTRWSTCPTCRAVVFKEHEGSFLVGMMAAMASKTGKVGFIGGMDIPLIRKFQCGYEQGAKYANPKVELTANMTGTTPAAWNDPARGGELAKAQFAKGVDVVFAAAGGTGVGVYQAAKDAGKLAIGVDSNQNHLQPGTMLTSWSSAWTWRCTTPSRVSRRASPCWA
jgi:basic membrane protein A